MDLEIDANTTKQAECSNRQYCWRRRRNEDGGLRAKKQKCIRAHPPCDALIGEPGQHDTLHTRHRQRLCNASADTPKGHKAQHLRQGKSAQTGHLGCTDRRSEKPEKKAHYLKSGRSVLGAINVAGIQSWVERVALPAQPRRRGDYRLRVIEIARVEKITNEKSELQSADEHDGCSAATFEPAQTA